MSVALLSNYLVASSSKAKLQNLFGSSWIASVAAGGLDRERRHRDLWFSLQSFMPMKMNIIRFLLFASTIIRIRSGSRLPVDVKDLYKNNHKIQSADVFPIPSPT
jgi:hypothetical protein